MSTRPLSCEKCKVAGSFESYAAFSPGQELNYAVSWVCPECKRRAVDVCPIGPLVPTASSCLNCGADMAAVSQCGGCGMGDAEAIEFLGAGQSESVIDDARSDIETGLARRGLARLNLLLRSDPASADAWTIKAVFYQVLGFHDSAARTLRHGATAAKTPALLVSAGFSLQEQKRHEEAVDAYREFLTLESESPQAAVAWCNLANSLSAVGDAAAADEAFRKALDLDPTRATHYYNFYLHLAKVQRWSDATAILREGLSKATDDAQRVMFLRRLSYDYAEREEGEPALRTADEALAIDAHSVGARYLRGRALGLVGRLTEALQEMEGVLSVQPGHADATAAVEMLRGAGARSTSRPWWRFWK